MAVTAALTLSCRVEEPVLEGCGNEEIKPVTVSLDLAFADEVYGTPQTRAIDDPGDVASTQIRNMCILQFAGKALDAPIVGDVHYLRADVNPEDENYLNLNQIKLADSMGAEHTLVFLTNTFAQIPAVETLGDMLALWRTAGGEPAVFGHDGDGASFPDDATYYQRMNALAVTKVDNGTIVHGFLRRSMARINVEIVNDGTDHLKIHSVQLRNVSQKDYYVTDYSYIASYTDAEHFTPANLMEGAFQDVYDPKIPQRTDYAARTWAQGGGTNDGSVNNGEGTGTAHFRWYVPSNMRGTDSSCSLKEQKNMSQNSGGATYLYIVASYNTTEEPILYRFYLGENLVNNFDLKPNTSYSYRLTFNGKGNTTTDKRVEDLGSRKFEYDANCYILNPSPLGDRTFSFNVVHRPNVFWGSSNEGDRYGFYDNGSGQYPNHYIRSNEHWYARVLWSDYPYTPEQINAMLVNKTGTGAGNYDDDISRVKVRIPSDIVRGNIVIGVWANDGSSVEANSDVILWSWHLWITDYQPDRIIGHTPDAETFVYNVDGGQVHRYASPAWTSATGRYKNGYIMDRNLGAQDRSYHGNARSGGLYYQFGRKDPFAANYTCYSYDYNGTISNVGYSDGTTESGSTGQNSKNVPWSVMNPRKYITGANWTSNDIFSPTGITWNDPMIGVRTEHEEMTVKSFFDPCPPGWKVPLNGWIGDLVAGPVGTTSTTVNWVWNGHSLGTGSTYYPEAGHYLGNKDNENAQVIFFPASGYRNLGGGTMEYVGGFGYCWSSTPSSTTTGYQLRFNSTSVSSSFSLSRAIGYPVRCVRE